MSTANQKKKPTIQKPIPKLKIPLQLAIATKDGVELHKLSEQGKLEKGEKVIEK